MSSSRDIGNLAEAKSEAQDVAEGYVCDKKPYSQWQSKDLLAFDDGNGFDRVCVAPNKLTRWTQTKAANKVSQEVLRDMIKWQSDFTVDNVPSALVFLDVWEWADETKKDMKMERWGLVRMMAELAQREYKAELAKAKADELAKQLVASAESAKANAEANMKLPKVAVLVPPAVQVEAELPVDNSGSTTDY